MPDGIIRKPPVPHQRVPLLFRSRRNPGIECTAIIVQRWFVCTLYIAIDSRLFPRQFFRDLLAFVGPKEFCCF